MADRHLSALHRAQCDEKAPDGHEVAAGLIKGYEESGNKCPYIIGQEHLLVGQLLNLPTIDHKSYSLGKLAFKQALSESISQEVLISEFLSQDK